MTPGTTAVRRYAVAGTGQRAQMYVEGILGEHAEVAAVLGTHTFGLPPSAAVQQRWREISREHGVPLVIDAAAGFGGGRRRHALRTRPGGARVLVPRQEDVRDR